MICPKGCDAEFAKKFLDSHLKVDCPRRKVNCQFCDLTLTQAEEIEHLDVCEKYLVPCPNGCKKKEIPRCEVRGLL